MGSLNQVSCDLTVMESMMDFGGKLEEMVKNNEALKRHIEQSSLEDINSSFELEEIVSNDEDKEMEERIKRREMERKLETFARESVWFKRIPIPDGRSEESFQRDIKEAFKKVLPETMVEGFLPKHCGLCDEQFEELKWAHKHYTGYNHRGAIKSFFERDLSNPPTIFQDGLGSYSN